MTGSVTALQQTVEMDRYMVTPLDSRVEAPAGTGRSLAQHPAIMGLIIVLLFGGYAVVWIWGTNAGSLARLFPLSILSGTAAVLWAIGQRAEAGYRSSWTALAVGQALWAAAVCTEALTEGLLLPDSTIISPLLMIGANACWIYTLLIIYGRHPVRLRITGLLDAVLVLGCGIILAGNSVLGPLWLDREAAIFPFGQAAIGLLVLTALVFLRYTIEEPLPAAEALALSGVLIGLVSESWQLWSAGSTLVIAEPVLGTLRLAAGLLILFGAYEALVAPEARRTAQWGLVAHWLPLICLMVISGLLILHFTGQPLLTPVFYTALLILLLAVLRLGFALGDNRRLLHEQTQLRSQNQEYIQMAISDALTGLFNKGYFTYQLHEEVARSERYKQPLTLITLDLDNFKQVNDRYGHAAGDTLLIAIGGALRISSREVDVPCRCGGDEFMLILPQTSVEQGIVVAERVWIAINGVLRQRGYSPLVSVSIGVVGHPGMATSAEELTHRADQALYFAKQSGKNRCALWTPALMHQLDPGLPADLPR